MSTSWLSRPSRRVNRRAPRRHARPGGRSRSQRPEDRCWRRRRHGRGGAGDVTMTRSSVLSSHLCDVVTPGLHPGRRPRRRPADRRDQPMRGAGAGRSGGAVGVSRGVGGPPFDRVRSATGSMQRPPPPTAVRRGDPTAMRPRARPGASHRSPTTHRHADAHRVGAGDDQSPRAPTISPDSSNPSIQSSTMTVSRLRRPFGRRPATIARFRARTGGRQNAPVVTQRGNTRNGTSLRTALLAGAGLGSTAQKSQASPRRGARCPAPNRACRS
jgi:hypothetical protein